MIRLPGLEPLFVLRLQFEQLLGTVALFPMQKELGVDLGLLVARLQEVSPKAPEIEHPAGVNPNRGGAEGQIERRIPG